MKYATLELINALQHGTKLEIKRVLIDTKLPRVKDIDQNNIRHTHTLEDHCLNVVGNLPRDSSGLLLLAGYYHDIGKPAVMTTDESGNSHFIHHPEKGVDILKTYTSVFGFDEVDEKEFLFYVRWHDITMNRKMHPIRKLIREGCTWRMFCNLMMLEIADAMDHVRTEHTVERVSNCFWSMSDAGKILFDAVWDEEKAKQ